MSVIDWVVIGFIATASILGACGWGLRWLKRIAGLVLGAVVGALLLGTAGLVFLAWSPPDSSVSTAFRKSPVLSMVTNKTANLGCKLGIDLEYIASTKIKE